MTAAARALAGAVLGTLLAAAAVPSPAPAQGVSGLTGGTGALEIEAEDGIEWRRDSQVYIARGNAKATRGEVTVHADRLVAHYRDREGGSGTEIYRVEAIGQVRIDSRRETAYGDEGVYDVDRQVMVLTGDELRLVTGEEVITARDSLEYWQARDLAVARGDAMARRGDRRIAAEVLTAYFTGDDEDGTEKSGADDGGRDRAVERIEAVGDVRISSPQSFARGDKGVYTTADRIATLVGNVKITRGENQLNGGWAEVNLETGISRLRGAPPDSDRAARVKGLLVPRAQSGETPGPDGPAAEGEQ